MQKKNRAHQFVAVKMEIEIVAVKKCAQYALYYSHQNDAKSRVIPKICSFAPFFFLPQAINKKKIENLDAELCYASAEEMRNDFWYVSFLFTALSLLVFSFRLRNLFSLVAIKCSLKIVIHHQERSTHNAFRIDFVFGLDYHYYWSCYCQYSCYCRYYCPEKNNFDVSKFLEKFNCFC